MKRLLFAIFMLVLPTISNWAQDDDSIGILNGHDWIDLGLPSGNLWASCNLGADRVNDLGEGIMWGEKKKHTEKYFKDEAWKIYKFYVPEKNTFDKDGFIKYEKPYVIDIGRNISGTQYDAARVRWGAPWQMPTKRDFEELMRCCTIEYLTYYGVKGWKITGRNDNWIFLPIEKLRVCTGVYYWCADTEWETNAYTFSFKEDSKSHCRIWDDVKCSEWYIRPITKKR